METINWKKRLINLAVIVGLFLFSFLAYFLCKPHYGLVRNGVVGQCLGVLLLIITIAIGVVLKIKNKLSFSVLITLLFVASFIVRLTYMLNTPFNCRQYDTVTTNNDGHQDYAWIIYTTNNLPTTNVYQFYHPPLNAFMQSIFMHITRPLLPIFESNFGGADYVLKNNLYQTCQILSLLYMTITIYFGVKIVNKFKLSKPAKIIGMCFVMFFPRLIQLSAQLNNDAICLMFSIIAIYFTICWWEKKSFFNIIMIAIAEGLAMMSKLSGATICLLTAVVFIIEFVKTIKSKESHQIINICIQFIVFLVICGGLGLWFQVYAKIRFNQPFAYVFSNLNHELYTGDHNFFARFINIFEFKDLFHDIFAHAFDDYNLFNYTLKSATFGEFSYWQGEGFAFVSLIAIYIFSIAFMVILVMTLVGSKKDNPRLKIVALTIMLSQIVSYIYFNIKMPYGCTMDFRYITPIIMGPAILLPYIYDYWNNGEHKIMANYVVKPLVLVEAIYLSSSFLFYLVSI